jgi:hypothetical protein
MGVLKVVFTPLVEGTIVVAGVTSGAVPVLVASYWIGPISR